jgi:hypothetical protein
VLPKEQRAPQQRQGQPQQRQGQPQQRQGQRRPQQRRQGQGQGRQGQSRQAEYRQPDDHVAAHPQGERKQPEVRTVRSRLSKVFGSLLGNNSKPEGS